MQASNWLGPLFIVAGLVLGSGLAAGMNAAAERTRAPGATPVARAARVPAPIDVPVGPGDAESGRVPYLRTCGGCHGADGKGGDVPLHGPLLTAYYPDDGALAGLIRNGLGKMPDTPPQELSDQQMADVIAFIRALP
jgi:mono/diheme cytochrome c family protein